MPEHNFQIDVDTDGLDDAKLVVNELRVAFMELDEAFEALFDKLEEVNDRFGGGDAPIRVRISVESNIRE